ncbi:hypothetical protein ACHAW5_002783 [Stephanodiscus triporus]|uniref:HSF-type DNA-binding domain-containing protein n=1 Tax=Stephanodiscus triporus TaxID=2934178 RepID=A0ABD3QC98_9STRA
MCITFSPNIQNQQSAPQYSYNLQEEGRKGPRAPSMAGQSPPSGAPTEIECGRNNGIDSQHASGVDGGEFLLRKLLVTPPLYVDGFKDGPWSTRPDGILLMSATSSLGATSPTGSHGCGGCTAVSIAAASDTIFLTHAPSPSSTASVTKRRRKRGPQRPGKTAKHEERLFVQHNYHDLSSEIDTFFKGYPLPASTPLLSLPFPLKLHRILEDSEAAGLGHIISWQPHGRAFKMLNPTLFAEKIMRIYFPKMKKVTSFQRQFNVYGFERLSRDGPDVGAYYHEAFLRHFPWLCLRRMTRRRVKGTGYKAAGNPDVEPDLYAFPSVDEVMKKRVMGAISGTSLQTHPYHLHVGLTTRPQHSSSEAKRKEDAMAKLAISYACLSEKTTTLHQGRDDSMCPPPHMPSNVVPPRCQQYHPLLTDSNNGMSHQIQHHPSPDNMVNDSIMNGVLSSSEENQDLFLKEFFANNDLTPLSVTTSPSGGQPQTGQQQQQYAHDPIMFDFVNLWESC